MCGRFAFFSLTPEVVTELGVAALPADLRPRYNIAPTQDAAVVLGGAERHLKMLRWGLVPHWAKDPSLGSRMINARAETLAQKPAFRDALQKRRCLVPADGFYEWKKEGSRKQPFFIRARSGRPLKMAGLWESWRGGQSESLETFTIITCSANHALSALHDRMPVLLEGEKLADWLDGDFPRPEKLLDPAPDEWLETIPVSARINSPANDDAGLLEPSVT